MSVDLFDTGSATGSGVERDRWGRPLIVPPDGGKPRPYTRCTTFADCLDDRFALERWKQRMVAIGLVARPDLRIAVAAAARDDKRRLDALCGDALEAANANDKARIGTALHAFAEQADLGQLFTDRIPPEHQGDIAAYRDATSRMDHAHVEQFMVCDELGVAGTPDRVSRVGRNPGVYIADIKTGDITKSLGKIAMQLALYAHSVVYDPVTGRRTPIAGLDTDQAVIIHLPAGQAQCELLWIDIAAGWEGVQLARDVRNWRARKHRPRPLTPYAAPRPATWAQRIAAASSLDELTAIWTQADAAGQWTDALTSAAATRKTEFAGGKP
ncbi:MAG: hypothetical protein ACRD0P_20890, partial [Stackebrandtia sp.]